MNREKLFLDTEFTGLHQQTTLISLGIVAESGKSFYAEFSDFDPDQVTDWLTEHILHKLSFQDKAPGYLQTQNQTHWKLKGDQSFIRQHLHTFLQQFSEVEIWSDCLAYDWVLFCELFGGSLHLPKNVFYMPFDLVTLFHLKGIDPNTTRETFVQEELQELEVVKEYNALWDAKIESLVFNKLSKI